MKEVNSLLNAALQLSDGINTDSAAKSLEVLRHFSAAVNNGIQPHPGVMSAIARVFSDYLCQPQIVGRPEKFKSLDECLNLKPKQGVGHPIPNMVDHSIRMIFLYQMCLYRLSAKNRGESCTLIGAAAWVSDNWRINGESMDADTLKRYYTEIGGDDFFINKAQAFEKSMGI